MKTKFYKLLSVMLALVIAFSACLCIVNAETGTGTPATVKPDMTQGTIDGAAGAIMPNVSTRIHTVDLLPIAHFTKATIASGYKTYFHFYDANEGWIGSTEKWIEAGDVQIKDLPKLPSNAKFFKVVLGKKDDANILDVEYDTNALILTTSSEYVAPIKPVAGVTYSPAMTQGTVDGNAGEIKDGVETRIYTTELIAIADCFSVELDYRYKSYYHFYDANKAWIGSSGKWMQDTQTNAEIKGMSSGAVYFRLVVGLSNDANLPVNEFYLDTLKITLFAGLQAPEVPDLPVAPEEPDVEIPEGGEPIVYPENSYFISAKGKTAPEGKRPEGLGTLENPVKTFADVTRLIVADGLGEGDTAYVFIKSGERVFWSDGDRDASNKAVPYTCNIVLDSTNPDVLGTLYQKSFLDFVGDMTFKNVHFLVDYMYGAVRLSHYDVVFEKGSVVELPELFIGEKYAPASYDKDFNLEIRGSFKASKFFLMSYFRSGTYNGDINILVDSAEASVPLLFTGYETDNVFTYNGNININILNAKTLSLGTYKGVSTFNGALQLMVDKKVNLSYAVKTNFDSLEIGGGKWYITRDSKDADFIQFSADAGKFNVKNKATAYIRQLGGKLITDKDGVVDLSKSSGAYTISDKPIDELLDDSYKMLYFKCGGGSNTLLTFASVIPGETYRFEYSIYTSHFDDSYPTCRVNGDRAVIGDDMKIISKKAYKNYYKIVSEITIPDNYMPEPDKGTSQLAFFGVYLASSSMGVIFDRNVYNVKDTKTNLIRNPQFHEGLDHVTLNFDFWGAVYTDSRGGTGLLEWDNGIAELAVRSFDSKFIDNLIYLADPDDGEWWNPEDYVEETYETYADVIGTFKDQDGNPIKGVKFLLVSEDNSYDTKTNSKGEFSFKKIVTGFYDLLFVDGKEKIETGFSSYIGQDDIVKFNVISDLTALFDEIQNDQQEEIETDEEVEIIPTGNFAATVYTARLDTVAGLRVILGDIGEVVTDANGSFAFANIPVGTYELYTVLNDGSKYVFREVVIEENRDITSKLKFDPAVESDNPHPADNGWIVWVIVASAVALVIVAGLIFLLVFKKKAA